MKTAVPLLIARLMVAICAAGNLVGFLWFGHPTALLVAAGAGIVVWLSARPLSDLSRFEQGLFLAGATAVLAGEGISAADYYLHLNIPGNDHAWEVRAPFIVLTLYIWWGITYGRRYSFRHG
jgi:hypothetical protein